MFDCLPNQVQGFARNAGEAFHSAMWREYLGGMAPCLGLAGRNPADPGPGRYDGALTGLASALSVTASPIGPAIRFNGNVAIQWDGQSGTGNKFKCATDENRVTLHVYFRYVHKGSTTKMSLFRSDTPTLGVEPYGYHLYVEANGDSLVLEGHRGETGGETPPIIMPIYTASGVLTGGKWHNAVVTWCGRDADNFDEFAQFVMMYIDGTTVSPTFSNTERTIVHLATHHSRCGASLGQTAPDLEVALLEVWNRRLYGQEIYTLMADPLAVFRRRGGALSKGSRLVSIGGTALRRLNVAVAG